MKYKIELVISVDPDHPFIDSTGDATDLVEDLLRDWIYDDDYVEVESLEVSGE